eukprot:3661986-Rhodomonas_salina.1
MSGYSLGYPSDVFEATLQHALPLAGHYLADVWVRFTEARLVVLQARSASTSQAKQIDNLTAALARAQIETLETKGALAETQAKVMEAERACKAQTETSVGCRKGVLGRTRRDPILAVVLLLSSSPVSQR